MKKVAIVLILSLFFTGCSATYNDSIKIVDKMDEIIKKEILFNEYKLRGNYLTNTKETPFYLIKKGDVYHFNIDNEDYYIEKNNDFYHVYSNVENIKYHVKLDDDIDIILMSLISRVNVNILVKDTYINVSNQIRTYLNRCNSNDEIVICNMEKKLFNKLNLEIILLGDIDKRVNTYRLNNGKLMYMSSKYIRGEFTSFIELDYDYGKQNIESINKSEYKIKSS